MQFDIIPVTGTEVGKLSTAQLRLLMDAQNKKNELLIKAERELKAFSLSVMGAGMAYSSLIESKRRELDEEVWRKCAVIADDLLFDISAIGQSSEGGGGSGGDAPQTEYRVDYSLSYSERYVIVRDYYLRIKDVSERMTKYASDEVAKKYLGTYYKTLYNVLATYEK